MATRGNQFIDVLMERIDQLPVASPADLARVVPLYIKAFNERGVVCNMSIAYIGNYDGRAVYRRFTRHFDQIHSMFIRYGLHGGDVRGIVKRTASRWSCIPRTVKQMDAFKGMVFEETQRFIKCRKLTESRERLVAKFKVAVKHYLNMTYELGFNEPSACVKHLAENHTIDKYIMSGDFAVILLPFMPEVEETIRRNYEHYEMKDAWENLKGRYFNHKAEYATMATEIKSTFNRTIGNFSQYFDSLYTDTYYRMRLSRRERND